MTSPTASRSFAEWLMKMVLTPPSRLCAQGPTRILRSGIHDSPNLAGLASRDAQAAPGRSRTPAVRSEDVEVEVEAPPQFVLPVLDQTAVADEAALQIAARAQLVDGEPGMTVLPAPESQQGERAAAGGAASRHGPPGSDAAGARDPLCGSRASRPCLTRRVVRCTFAAPRVETGGGPASQ